MTSGSEPARPASRSGLIKSSQDLAGGVFLLALAAFGFFGTGNLKFGTLGGMGPGLLPKIVSVLVAGFGLLLIVESMTGKGSAMQRWSLRGPLFVLGAALVFAATIRGSTYVLGGFDIGLAGVQWSVPVLLNLRIPPLGLVVAGPLAVLVASLADPGISARRLLEMLIFAVVLTLFCIALFKYALNLPIPLAPWWRGY